MPGITTQIQQMWIYADRARDYAGKRSFSGNMNFYSLKVVYLPHAGEHIDIRNYR